MVPPVPLFRLETLQCYGAGEDDSIPIDQIVREGARRTLAEALQSGVEVCIARFADERDEQGHQLVVRNGYHEAREVLTSAGVVEVRAPRVNDKRIDPTPANASGSLRRSCHRWKWRCCRFPCTVWHQIRGELLGLFTDGGGTDVCR